MKLSFSPQGADFYTAFADDTAGDLITGFAPKMQGIAQVTPLFRAANQLVSARNNRVWTIEGTVEKALANAYTAVAYLQSLAAGWPDFIDLKIEEGATALYLTPAVIVKFEPVVEGCSLTVHYGFVGSNLTQPVSSGS